MKKKFKNIGKTAGEVKENVKQQNFETCLKRMEEIVSILEEGAVSLEESIKLYEEGIELARICMTRLNEAELKIKKLNKSINGHINFEEFSLDE